jgi:hypothetical protein
VDEVEAAGTEVIIEAVSMIEADLPYFLSIRFQGKITYNCDQNLVQLPAIWAGFQAQAIT